MVIVAPVARASLITTCRVATTVGGLTLGPGGILLGLAALGAVGFIAYQALRNDYEVTVKEVGMGPLKLKGVHLVKSGSLNPGGAPTTQAPAIASRQDAPVLLEEKRTEGEGGNAQLRGAE